MYDCTDNIPMTRDSTISGANTADTKARDTSPTRKSRAPASTRAISSGVRLNNIGTPSLITRLYDQSELNA